jgi:hypothetical protein
LLKVIGMETWTLRAVYQKHLESFEMWCWRRMEKISWTDRVINEDVYLESRSRGISCMKYVNGRRTGLVTFWVETASYNGVIEGEIKGGIEVTGRRGIRRRNLLDELRERRGYSHLKEEALDHTM